MRKKPTGTLAVATAVAGIAVGSVAGVGDTDEPERPITGTALEQASAAALRHTGGGRVTATQVGDEDSYYELEVTRDDGSEVEVHLDEQFAVVGQKADDSDEGPQDD